MLTAIAVRPLLAPPVAGAQSSLSGVQFTFYGQGLWFFDTRSGDTWFYNPSDLTDVEHIGRLVQLGKPLLVDKKN